MHGTNADDTVHSFSFLEKTIPFLLLTFLDKM